MEKINSQKLKIELTGEMIGGYQKFIIKGKLIYTTIQWAKQQVDELIRKEDGYIVDLHNITQIDSTGFGFLINLGKKLMKNDENMVILVKDKMIRELFGISKLDQVFCVVETLEDGINILNKKNKQFAIKLEEY
ncbi:STAS domain-containing protein [Crassaminicella profunda]|uniref:STAS domain-containing protein n=1 Tax=Crassaminicella profunda TaxID=1286698 RepID=UPI001CA77E97|nr:STAS domain-containing protein [Crassaminicella profunda]QZY54684.1 STAS domain-containing protein [Crassaminicella profunda]